MWARTTITPETTKAKLCLLLACKLPLSVGCWMSAAQARRASGSTLHSDEVCVLRTAALLSSQSGAGKTKWVVGWRCNYLPYDIVEDQVCWDWTAFSVGGKPEKNVHAGGLKWTGVGKTDRLITGSDWTVLGPDWIQGVRLSQLTNESIIFQSPGKPKYCLCVYLLAPVPNLKKKERRLLNFQRLSNFAVKCKKAALQCQK